MRPFDSAYQLPPVFFVVFELGVLESRLAILPRPFKLGRILVLNCRFDAAKFFESGHYTTVRLSVPLKLVRVRIPAMKCPDRATGMSAPMSNERESKLPLCFGHMSCVV